MTVRWTLVLVLLLGAGCQEETAGDGFGHFVDGEPDTATANNGGVDVGGVPDAPGLGDAGDRLYGTR